MHVQTVITTLVSLYNNENTRRRTAMLMGPSGVGKSAGVAAAAGILRDQYGEFEVVDLRLSQFDPVDFRGVPSVVEGRTVWNPPIFFPRQGTRGFLFLDEITSSPPAVQAVAYQMTNDRKVGDYELPEGWMVIAAGNRMSDRGVTFNMAAPLLNRMTLIDVQSSLDDFIDYAIGRGIRPEIIAFLKSRGDYLNERDEKINTECHKLPAGKPFATQRAWAESAQFYLDYPADVRIELLKGSIGERATPDFEAFLRIWESMPSIDLIFKDPASVQVPTDAATRYAVSVGVAMRIDSANVGNAMAYMERMPKEFRTMTVKMAYRRDSSIAESAAIKKWMKDNYGLFERGN